MSATLECIGLQKHFSSASGSEMVLKGVSLSFLPDKTSLLLGPSGSGKTTLLSVLGFLLSPSSGTVLLNREAIDYQNKSSLALIRRKTIGFVFQHAQLLPFLNVRENLQIVGRNAGLSETRIEERLATLAERLEITQTLLKKPAQLSGGQKQRVAIARALVTNPSVVLADEPTAALDWNNAQSAVRLLLEECTHAHAVLIAVTHDTRLIPLFDRILTLNEGIIHEKYALDDRM
jgi:ABC-type lipoprotein export system ATPase subunit